MKRHLIVELVDLFVGLVAWLLMEFFMFDYCLSIMPLLLSLHQQHFWVLFQIYTAACCYYRHFPHLVLCFLQVLFSPALSREFRPYKPNPDPLLHICATWGVHPNEVLMIGDSLKDDVGFYMLFSLLLIFQLIQAL